MIFTLSNSSLYAGGGGALYVSSKHACAGIVRQLAYEFAPEVRVNGVAPGATRTSMRSLEGLHPKSAPLDEIPDFEELAAASVPLQRIAEPDDHTGLYLLLASRSNSASITGQIFSSDGGWEVRAARG
jgi:NAD(P)-dependent dehydrogenase (short-subunit alcohol dehydrogenase family)